MTVHVVDDTYKPVATAPVQTIGSQIVGSLDRQGAPHLERHGRRPGHLEVRALAEHRRRRLLQGQDDHRSVRQRPDDPQPHVPASGSGRSTRPATSAAYATGPLLKFVHYQETSASYPLPWNTVNSTSYSGGHAKTTSIAGHSASLRTTGRTFTWIGAHGPTRSTADVYVDGVFKAHVNLFSSIRSYGRVIYSITFATKASHQINIVYTGPSTGRIDLDQIIVLR